MCAHIHADFQDHYTENTVSQANVMLIHQVIPIIDYVRTELDKVINDYGKLAIVWHAAQNAAMIIDKYYACTDESVMYWVAIHTFFFVLQFCVLIVITCMWHTLI